jgi:membrane protein
LARDLLGGQLSIHAMGLVYATLLALVPLVAFSFALLRVFGAHRELEPLIYDFFRPMGAAAGPLTARVMDFADHVRGGILGSVGLALLIWTLIATLKKVEDSLNFVWHVEQPRSFMRRIAEYLALLVVAPLLIGALIGMAHMTSANSSVRLLTHLPLIGKLRSGALALAPYAIVSAAFAMLYTLVPNTRVQRLPAIVGGLAGGVLWAAVGGVFASIVVYSTRLSVVYAGFAIFIAALIWIYFSWLILLLGAQLSFYVQNPSYLRIGLREPRLSNAETEQLALSIMYLVAQAHLRGSERWSINSLAAALAIPGIALARVADALEGAGLLVATEQDALLPGRDSGQIRVREILAVARAANSVHGEIQHGTPPAVAQLCADFEGAWRERLGERDLESLVED